MAKINPNPFTLGQQMSVPEGMHDVGLKTKLLRSLLREYVPSEKHPFRDPLDLSYVVSSIKTYKLLSERASSPLQQDLVDAWKSAVDSWVRRLLSLASCNMPDKCWAGLCLLGLTCQECSEERFLAAYSIWLNQLLSRIQTPVVSNLVKAASCASLSDLFTRLSGFSNARKDGTSQATRVIESALNLLYDDSSIDVLKGTLSLMGTLIMSFPLSVQRHYESIEAAIALKLMSGVYSVDVLEKLGYVLSVLPKSKGDESSWSLMLDKVLVLINSLLNDTFQGLEEEDRSTQTLRALLPCGKVSPPSLGGSATGEQTSDILTRRPERLLGSRISALMKCCCSMLINSYSVMVPVPVSGVIALVERVLMVDGSSLLPSYSFVTVLKQEFIFSEIPLLQMHSLEILTAVINGLDSQLLPHVPGVVQLLNEYMRRCKFPDLKIKAYSTLKILLILMGVGTAINISQDVVSNTVADLDFAGGEDGKSLGVHSSAHAELLIGSRPKKRKLSSDARSSKETPAVNGLDVEILDHLAPVSVKLAALETLEALLAVGGSMKFEAWRGDVNQLLITVARNACKERRPNEEREVFLSADPRPSWTDFQLAALRALLASLLSPGRIRPSHLSIGLELFHRGMQKTGIKLSEFCRHALLALEILLHPRGLPLLDHHSYSNEFNAPSLNLHDTFYSNRDRQISTIRAMTPGKDLGEAESEEDELNDDWLGKDDEMEIPFTEKQENSHFTGKPSATATATDHSGDELPFANGASITNVSQTSEMPITADIPNHKAKGDDERDAPSLSYKNAENQLAGTITSSKVDRIDTQHRTDSLEIDELDPTGSSRTLLEEEYVSKHAVVHEAGEAKASTSGDHVLETKNDSFDAIAERISARLANMSSGKGMMESDELLEDVFPDIVDGDPDSD